MKKRVEGGGCERKKVCEGRDKHSEEKKKECGKGEEDSCGDVM